ncbi:MAG: YibE/F family protein, partial [Victivallales bacterium]|nr:YibE/F family protein [Victivallales bacterium]
SKEKARVLSVDNSMLQELGLLQMGTQLLEVEVISGQHKGRTFQAVNELRAQMELDKIFVPGDTALVGILDGSQPGKSVIIAQDHYRITWTWLLFGIFTLSLLIFAGYTGLKALLSFVFSCVVLWRFLIPLCLMEVSPLGVTIVCVCLLTFVIIFLVAGFTRKGAAAFTGAMMGIVTGCAMSYLFTLLFKVNGAVLPYSQSLLYAGYPTLDIQQLFAAAIILASSGAVMDLGMDVAAGMEEINRHSPDIPRRSLIASGIRIGQSVVGTMTTTLLLAYSGGYLTLLMAFTAQGTSPIDFINNPHVASEVVKTLVGSFSLILVAPFTALAGGFIYKRGISTVQHKKEQ